MRHPWLQRLRRLARAAVLAGPLLAGPVLAEPPGSVPPTPAAHRLPGSLPDRIDHLLRDGFEKPQDARAELELLLQTHLADRESVRRLLEALALLDLQNGGHLRTEALAQRIDQETRRAGEALPTVTAQLLRAQAADAAGRPEVAAPLAQALLPALRGACAAADAQACDYRATWRALRLLQRRALMLGNAPQALAHEEAGLALARQAGDSYRQAQNHGVLALLQLRADHAEAARQHQREARRLADEVGDLRLAALLRGEEARLADQRRDAPAALRAREESHALALRAHAPRLAARLSANLSDSYARAQRPADALAAAERALPALRLHGDRMHERVAVNNAGIARIGLGRIAEGLADMDRVIAMGAASELGTAGAGRREAETLREFGEALAAAGAAPAALKLYHRERDLSARLMRNEAEAARHELRALHDTEAQQRRIELLAHDNALKTQALANGALRSRFFGLAALILAPAVLGAVLLYRRARRGHRALKASHARLREASERDPLTGLANRRHFHDRMQDLAKDRRPGRALPAQPAPAAGAPLAGALLLVDIDHFKRINDRHGHAAGDRVLVEVARRLVEAVRGDDLVVRWGGEEFLIHAASAGPEQAAAIAERVLHNLAREPVALDGGRLRITASVGHAHFPLPPDALAPAWEQALHLVDLALYQAKREGRNRAVGLASVAADVAATLHGEADLDRAVATGRVVLRRTAGPAVSVEVPAALAEAH